jgi:two-component sensor histidine kinase
LVLVVTAAWSLDIAEQRSWSSEQQTAAHEIASALERQAASDSAYLVTMSSLFANVGKPSRETFNTYIQRLRVVQNLSGVVGVGWVDEVNAKDTPAFNARMKAAYPDFRMKPYATPTKWPASVVTMLEPQTPENHALIGYDMNSEARRSAAMARAKRSGVVTASDVTKLLQDSDKVRSPGFIVYAAVRSFEEEARFLGFVYIPIRVHDFVTAAVSERLLASGRIEVIDSTPQGDETVFSSTPPDQRFGPALEETIDIFDQKWTLRYAPPAGRSFFPLSLVVLFGGGAFSTLLLAYVLLVQRRNGDLNALLDAQIDQEKERAAFIRELNHRVKNSLANVTSMISLSRYRTDDVQHFADTLLQRVKALAAGHALLDGRKWGPTDLRSIIVTQLNAHAGSEDRVDIAGPNVLISPNDALTLGLAVHELATNAARYGALSTDKGRIKVRWHITEDKWVEVDWQEEGGPPVTAPERMGLGLNLVQRALAHELRRPIDIEFNPSGLRCHFFVQLRTPRSFQLRQ